MGITGKTGVPAALPPCNLACQISQRPIELDHGLRRTSVAAKTQGFDELASARAADYCFDTQNGVETGRIDARTMLPIG